MRSIGSVVFVIVSTIGFAQTRQITGRIVDEDSQKGVPGANVTISDTQPKAITNQLGYFSVDVEPADKSMEIASLGYLTAKIDVPVAGAFKVAMKKEYLAMEPLDLGRFKVQQLDPAEFPRTLADDQVATNAEYRGGWLYFYNDLATVLKNEESFSFLIPQSAQKMQFTVLNDGTISNVRSAGASDSLIALVGVALESLKPWRPARQNKVNVPQHYELPLSWTRENYTVVEQSATPVGGLQAFYKLIGENIRYPAAARRSGLEGKVFVEFLIQKDGTITDARSLVPVGGGLDEEAIRIVLMSPKWNPGTIKGEPVVQRYTLPIQFKLGGRR